MDIRDFLSRLRVDSGPNGKGEYMCRCPAHDDKNASLCVRDGEKGIVLKCQAGCDVESVVSAMGLKMRDLFHEQQQTSSTQNRKTPAAKPAAKPSGAKKPRGKFVCAYQYTDESGKVLFEACRYQRPDGDKTFSLRQPDPTDPSGYKWTKEGARLVLYRLPEVLKAIKDGRPVFVCEGEKDCDNMAKLGYVATTNPMGAGKWHVGDYTPSLKGADLYIIPDNDDVGRDHAKSVAQAAVKVAKAVHIIDLSKGCEKLPPKGDASDFFELLGESAGRAALEKLMQTAEAFEADAIAQRDAAAEYYSKVYGYCVSNGRICQETADGPKPLANFVAVPRAVVAQDDGVNVNKIMVIDGWDALGAPLPRVQIKAAQFSGMNWVAEKWDFAASIMPGNTVKDKIRYAISEVGRMTAKRITEYSHTGWRQIGGKWAYLYQGGAIGVDNVTVDLGSGLNGYRLDGSGAEGWDKLTYLDGAEVTLTIGNVIAEHVAIPLLGTIFLAPLREFLAATGIAPAYALFLLGGTGTRKSTALALALSHFGNFTGKSLPASFNDTANFIRKKAFLLKDAPIVVDDYHPVTSLQERKKMEATAQSLARAFGDGAERGRMKADLTLQEAMPPRGVAIISGEDTPGVGESGMARFYVVNVGKGKVTVKISGIAASAASVIAMAGDEVLMSPVAYMMIHDPWTYAMGNAREMEHQAQVLREIGEGLIAAYTTKTGKSRDEIADLLAAETYMNAEQAVREGFADGILYEEAQEPAQQPQQAMMMQARRYGPAAICAMVRAADATHAEGAALEFSIRPSAVGPQADLESLRDSNLSAAQNPDAKRRAEIAQRAQIIADCGAALEFSIRPSAVGL